MWVYDSFLYKNMYLDTQITDTFGDYSVISHSARMPGCKLAGMRIHIYAKIELVFCEKYKNMCICISPHALCMQSSKFRPLIGPEKLCSRKKLNFSEKNTEN